LYRKFIFTLSYFYTLIFFFPASGGIVGKDGFEPPNSGENRFTVCCRWPLDYLPEWFLPACKNTFQYSNPPFLSVSLRGGSNPRPADYKSAALPTELLRLDFILTLKQTFLQRTKTDAITPCFFGKAKVSDFVKWKNFEVFFLENTT
jgi:hypothetical protein